MRLPVGRGRRIHVPLPLAVLLLIGALALAAPLLAPHDPTRTDVRNALDGPSWSHWLGTDDLGRDIVSRLLYAGRTSLGAALLAVGISSALGLPLGIVAGYFGGRVDAVLNQLNDVLMAFPALILATAVVGVLGPSLTSAMVGVGIVYAPRLARVARSAAMAIRPQGYIEYPATQGGRPSRTILRHVVPNVMSPIVVQVTLCFSFGILAEGSLSFLGMGVQPPTPSWGSMLLAASAHMDRAPLFVLAPGLLIGLVVLLANAWGDSIQRAVHGERLPLGMVARR